MKSLFIGGVADGRWIEHNADVSTMDVLGYPPPICVDYTEPSSPELVAHERHTYRRHSMNSQHLNFFALGSMNSGDVMQKLIENYRPVTETGNLK